MGRAIPVARAIREARESAALTQRELATRAGLSLQALSNLERGRVLLPRVHTLRALASALGLRDAEVRIFVVRVRSLSVCDRLDEGGRGVAQSA